MIGFSRALRAGGMVYVSGTCAVNADGTSAGGDDAAAQMRRCLEIIRAALQEGGASMDDVVRTRMYLTHADDWEAVGRVHGEFFRTAQPAATMVVVSALLRPEWRVEVEAEALLPQTMKEA
jgi:enamine deaminase RidA (YjgF/YER057c/UK114 family)